MIFGAIAQAKRLRVGRPSKKVTIQQIENCATEYL